MTEAPSTLPAALLWDLDGTLVDTEPLWIAAEMRMMHEFDLPWTEQDAHQLVGKPITWSAALFRERGLPLEIPQIADRLVGEVMDAVAQQGPPWRPGAHALLSEAAAAGVPQAIVTMSYRRQAELVTTALGPGVVSVIVAGDMVQRGKPDPEAYLRAADLLGVDIRACIAVEDSVTGTAAALASGARTIAVPLLHEIAPAPGLSLLSSLEGISLHQLVAAAP
ncbi:HAD family hydrolase [Serinibacter salmoneus]|uniref:HAD superfamily hydrolase (TIGR01509 family) n=1 Tax=Serinibacter salmoneus TaxID=556530 RepID=A0A2A9CZB3_9MICO|nr:HAD family phosphatase [Serinibacter salmoneus]PFG19777.1 HAD superfamily hydrolase (TIGR01509 family) [Serinibacter salmoneus]